MAKYNKTTLLDVRWHYVLFLGVPTRRHEIMVSGPNGNESVCTFKRLLEDSRWDAGAVTQVKGSTCRSQQTRSIVIGG